MRLPVAALALCLLAGPLPAQEKKTAPLRVGVTTHAYWSWVANVGRGTPVEPVAILPEGADPHAYQPRAEEIRRLAALDLLVAGGIGHDAWVDRLLAAAGKQAIRRVDLHQGVPLIPYHPGTSHGHGDEDKEKKEDTGRAVNPHTFLSISTAIQQLYNLQKGLAAMLPAHAGQLLANTRAYTARLRRMKADAAGQLVGARTLRVATVHDGYAYLLAEFGVRIALVVQPKHGIEPSPQELAGTIQALKKARVEVVFSELDFPPRYVELIRKETGVRLYHLSHVSRGPYAAEKFERDMRANLETLVQALR